MERASPTADRELVTRIQAGDEAAFTELVQRLHGGLIALARAYVRTPELAEEVVQDAWIAVLGGLASFEFRSSLKTWISGIVINQAKRKGERERRTLPFSALGGTSERAVDASSFSDRGTWLERVRPWRTDPEAVSSGAETRRFLEAELAKLPEAQRTVVHLRHVEGWSAEEVCAASEPVAEALPRAARSGR